MAASSSDQPKVKVERCSGAVSFQLFCLFGLGAKRSLELLGLTRLLVSGAVGFWNLYFDLCFAMCALSLHLFLLSRARGGGAVL